MAIEGVFHFNINVTDLDRSIAFYETVGFVLVSRQDFVAPPGTEAGMRIANGRGRQAVMTIGAQPGTPVLDMIEWQEPRGNGEPYPNLHHTGIARIALRTRGLQAVYDALLAEGVAFWSPPQQFGEGSAAVRYVCLSDPDGTTLELIELGA